jgi:hypothetical protein
MGSPITYRLLLGLSFKGKIMDFDSLLKGTLSVVTEGFQTAVTDLRDLVATVGQAIQRNAGEKFALEASEESSDLKGSTYEVYLDPDVFNPRVKIIPVAYFRIPANGYPIAQGSIHKSLRSFIFEKNLADKSELEQVFAALIQDPDSSLIQALGYALRAEEQDDGPF